jgi:hypothetical protein
MATEYSVKKSWLGGYKISYNCPNCSTALKSPLDDAGKTDSCPACNAQLVVPGKDARERIRSEERRAAEVARKATYPQHQTNEGRERLHTEPGYRAQSGQAGAPQNLEPPDNWLSHPLVSAKPNQKQDANQAAANVRPCPYCGEEILAVAKKCKHCGEFLDKPAQSAPIKVVPLTGKQTSKTAYGCLVLVILAVIVGISSTFTESGKKSGSSSLSDGRSMAWVMTQGFVEKVLKAPSTASYGGVFSGDFQSYEKVVSDLGDRKYHVRAWVDSQNSFGATIRTHFTCDLHDSGDGTWHCDSLLFDD